MAFMDGSRSCFDGEKKPGISQVRMQNTSTSGLAGRTRP
jgi:hypothetical protein